MRISSGENTEIPAGVLTKILSVFPMGISKKVHTGISREVSTGALLKVTYGNSSRN